MHLIQKTVKKLVSGFYEFPLHFQRFDLYSSVGKLLSCFFFFFPFNSVGFCFIDFNALLFGVYTLKTAK